MHLRAFQGSLSHDRYREATAASTWAGDLVAEVVIPVQHSAASQSLCIYAAARKAVVVWIASVSVEVKGSWGVQWHADVVCAQQLSMDQVGLAPRCAVEEGHLAAGGMMEDACVLQLGLLRSVLEQWEQ